MGKLKSGDLISASGKIFKHKLSGQYIQIKSGKHYPILLMYILNNNFEKIEDHPCCNGDGYKIAVCDVNNLEEI